MNNFILCIIRECKFFLKSNTNSACCQYALNFIPYSQFLLNFNPYIISIWTISFLVLPAYAKFCLESSTNSAYYQCRDVVVEGHIIEMGEPLEAGKGNGEGKGRGEVSLQATWDQSGQGSHHTQRRDSK
jgi:hypothetical protein